MTAYSTTAYCNAWGGSSRNARHVYGLTKAERDAIRAGQEIRLAGCPAYRGITERRIVAINGRFYARMPKVAA